MEGVGLPLGLCSQPVTCHLSHFTCHMSHVTCHISHIGSNVPGVRVLEGIGLPLGWCSQLVLAINVLPLGTLVQSHGRLGSRKCFSGNNFSFKKIGGS